MTNKSIVTALTFSFLAFTLSVLPVTTAEADCVKRTMSWQHHCLPGETESSRDCVEPDCRFYVFTCCTTPSEPYAKGGYKEDSTETPPSRDPALDCPSKKYDYAAKRCIERPAKNMGKGSTGTGEKPAAIRKAHCESQGPGYKYDPQTGACELKRMTKAKPQGAPEQAEEQRLQEEE
jgi:hypothetical protein